MPDEHPIVRALASEAERIEEDCTYTFKQLYEAAASATGWAQRIGSAAAILAALAGASVLAKLPQWEIAGPGLAFTVTAMTAWLRFSKPAEMAQRYKDAACDFQQLRDEARFFRETELGQAPDDQALVERVREFSLRRARLRKESPQPPPWAYQRVKRAIEQGGEATYAVDAEKSCRPDGKHA